MPIAFVVTSATLFGIGALFAKVLVEDVPWLAIGAHIVEGRLREGERERREWV